MLQVVAGAIREVFCDGEEFGFAVQLAEKTDTCGESAVGETSGYAGEGVGWGGTGEGGGGKNPVPFFPFTLYVRRSRWRAILEMGLAS